MEIMDLKTAIKETKEYLELNSDLYEGDISDGEAIEHLMDNCGKGHDGSCSMAGSEYCDWECPFSD